MPIATAKVVLAAGMLSAAAAAGIRGSWHQAAVPEVRTVTIPAGAYDYRPAGDYRHKGRAVDPPMQARTGGSLTVMTDLVTAKAYQQCVADRGCASLEDQPRAGDLPVVRVNWNDATAYAVWLSRRTGQHWRLPTDEEWRRAAGSQWRDSAVAGIGNDATFVERQLAKYAEEAALRRQVPAALRPVGGFGANELGVLDIGANVWEWTDTCLSRQSLDAEGNADGAPVINCGVRVVAGRHRTYMTDFIRDARSGGCALGAPPANLGFRLVRD